MDRAVDVGGGRSDVAVAVANELTSAGVGELLVDASHVPFEALISWSRALSTSFSGSLALQFEPAAIMEVEELLAAGVRRVAVQRRALEDPDFIADVTRRFGSEVLAVAISVRKEIDVWRVCAGPLGPATEWDAITWARVAEAQGAAELIVDVVGGPPPGEPYDLDLLAELAGSLARPVTARGNPRSPEDCFDALMIGNVDAVLLGPALFSGPGALREIRDYLEEHGVACA